MIKGKYPIFFLKMDISKTYPGLVPILPKYRFKLTELREHILYTIFEDGAQDPYSLYRSSSKGTYSTVHRNFGELEDNGFIYLTEVSLSKNKRKKLNFSLTPNGVIVAVSTGKSWEKVEKKCNKKWSNISPIFFKHWSLFEKTDFSEYMKYMIESIPYDYGYIPSLNYETGIGIMKEIHELVKKEKRSAENIKYNCNQKDKEDEGNNNNKYKIDEEAWRGIVREYENVIFNWLFKLDRTPFMKEALNLLYSNSKLRKRTLEYLNESIREKELTLNKYNKSFKLFKEVKPNFNSYKYSSLFWFKNLNELLKRSKFNDKYKL